MTFDFSNTFAAGPFRGGFPVIAPNPNNPYAPQPTPLDPELKELYARAAEDPEKLTMAEKHRAVGRLPPEDEDRICVENFGITWGELIAKTLADPEGLSKEETDVVCDGAQTRDPFHGVWYMGTFPFLSPGDDKLKRDALRRVRENHDQPDAEEKVKRLPWITDVINERLPRWGFVVFRTGYDAEDSGDAAWEWFKKLYEQTGETMMSKQWHLSGRNLWGSHETVFVSEPGLHEASSEELRARFRTMTDKGEVPEGIRKDCFLAVDEDVLTWMDEVASKGKKFQASRWTVFLRAVNANYDAKRSGDASEISVPLPKVCDWLFYSLFARRETWDQMHRKVRSQSWRENSRSGPTWPAYH